MERTNPTSRYQALFHRNSEQQKSLSSSSSEERQVPSYSYGVAQYDEGLDKAIQSAIKETIHVVQDNYNSCDEGVKTVRASNVNWILETETELAKGYRHLPKEKLARTLTELAERIYTVTGYCDANKCYYEKAFTYAWAACDLGSKEAYDLLTTLSKKEEKLEIPEYLKYQSYSSVYWNDERLKGKRHDNGS